MEQALPTPLRARTLDSREVTPDDAVPRRRLRTLHDVLEAFPEIADIIIDDTEQHPRTTQEEEEQRSREEGCRVAQGSEEILQCQEGRVHPQNAGGVTLGGLVLHLSAAAGVTFTH
ncbi:hypothetical protein GCM10010841_26890 [Deinococcus aerophilus]|uniref:Uncharacterized protein n=1 Tax=Deinococcus aerophilus TaxID=522488 RepID=A0ABQ2GY99_9DEIO|nr:hypothetical protein GCM10010841_26890 [Deinococcus aerophilus]